MQRYGVLNRDKMNYFITVLKSVITSFFSSFVAFFHNHPPLLTTFILFSLMAKKKRSKRETKKRPELMGRQAGSWKAEMNSLCSDNISAISSKPQPGSKDPFVRNVFYSLNIETLFQANKVSFRQSSLAP